MSDAPASPGPAQRPQRRARLDGWKPRALVAIGIVVVIAAAVYAATRTPSPTTHQRFITIASGPRIAPDRVKLDTQVYIPHGVDTTHPAPAVLLSHGFGGSRHTLDEQARFYARHGYVALAYSARGWDASTGNVALNSADHEVRDVRALIDWLATRSYVTHDSAADPRVGLVGGSYGGGISIMAATADRRIDAIVPSITWNDMVSVLAPNFAQNPTVPVGASRAWAPTPADARTAAPVGVFKKLWAAGMFTAAGNRAAPNVQEAGGAATVTPDRTGPPANGRVRNAPTICGRFTTELCTAYADAAATGRLTPEAAALLARSSPSSFIAQLRAPTMLVQGETDSLFPLSEADATARSLAARRIPLKMIWIEGGHDGAASTQDTNFVRAQTLTWFDRYLRKHDVSTGPGFMFALPGTGLSGSTPAGSAPRYVSASGNSRVARKVIPLRDREQVALNPPGGNPATISSLPGAAFLGAAASALGGFDIPSQHAQFTSAPITRELDVVGSSTVRVRLWSDTGQAVLFASLQDVDGGGKATTPQGLVSPIRVTGLTPARPGTPGREVIVTLPAIAHRFVTGHRIRVKLATTDQAYFNEPKAAVYNIALAPGAASVAVPLAPGGSVTVSNAGPAFYVSLAIIAAIIVVLVTWTLVERSRRRALGTITLDLERPLVVTGLTKIWGDGLRAVDDLSFTAERGQIVGLLGPNGAGKTTALRMVLGLVLPDAGTIEILGQPISPGAPVLARVGAFVEGPGVLPHLTGMQHLELYWRATGRPASEAGFDEVLEIAGLGSAVHKQTRTYSQGMRQRLAIAQAMLGMPEVLILDEPTNGLDPPQIHEMREVLRNVAEQGRTVIVSSHLLSEVEQVCTHAVVMGHGKLLASGPVSDLVAGAHSVFIECDDHEHARDIAQQLPGIGAVELAPGGLHVELDTCDRRDVVRALVTGGIDVAGVTARHRLEDVFLTLVEGHSV